MGGNQPMHNIVLKRRIYGKKIAIMKKRKKWFSFILCAIASCAFVLSGCANGQYDSQPANEQNVPQSSDVSTSESSVQEADNTHGILQSFSAKTLDGGTFTHEDFIEKDVTIINFWATFCGPCLAEMPDIAEFEKSLPDNVQLITACLDGERDIEGVESILSDAGYEGITLLGGDGDFEQVRGEIMYIPTTIIVDQNGNMLGDAIVGGQADLEETYRTAINNALLSMGKAELSDETN